MHYIIGTIVRFPRGQTSVGATSASPIAKKPKEFDYNKTYTLYNIRQTPGIVVNNVYTYMFKSDSGEIVEKQFDNPGDADRWLASSRGEMLPDYQSTYSQNRG